MENMEEYKEKIKTLPEWELEDILKRIDKEKFSDRCQAVEEELKSRGRTSDIFFDNSSAPPLYAGFWRRFIAMLIDFTLVGIACIIVMAALSMVFPGEVTGPHKVISDEAVEHTYNWTPANIVWDLVGWFSFLASWLYSASMESSHWQATLGKRLVGIKVTDLNGLRISFVKATVRSFLKYISALLLYIGYFMAAFTKKKQALHDMIAGCLVVRRTDERS